MSDSLQPHGLYSPWNSPGQNTEWVVFLSFRASSQTRDETRVPLPHCSQILYQLSYKPYAYFINILCSVPFSSVTQSCPTLCIPMNRSTPGLPVHHQLLEFTQTHVHQVSDAIQPSHPLSSPSPPAPNPSQHQGLFQWVNSSHTYFIDILCIQC